MLRTRLKTAAMAAMLLATAPAGLHAQVPEAPVSVTGKVISTSDAVVRLATDKGPVNVPMTSGWTVSVARPASAREIKPGDFVATTNQDLGADTGRSLELRIFEPGYEPEHGTHPMPKPGLSMTHGRVRSLASTADGEQLDVAFPGGSRRIVAPLDVKVTAYDVKDRSAAAPGVTVQAITRKGPDGVARAGRLLLVSP